MLILRNPSLHEAILATKRPTHDLRELMTRVEPIFERVEREGDRAVRTYTELFDQVELDTIEVPMERIEKLAADVAPDLAAAIQLAAANIEAFHNTQHRYEAPIETMPGVRVWRRPIPLERVGIYAPGGSAPLFSSVLMLGVPARLARCEEIVLATPPQADGSLHPAMAAAALAAGVHRIFLMGGAQAIAALALGTETVPRVDKILGPGNQYVLAAKQLAGLRGVAIDMPAGPSEVLVLADDSADVDFVAADLLSQAEHGPDSQVVLVTTSVRIVAEIEQAIEQQLQRLSRADIARQALEHSVVILTNTLEEAMAISNAYAPEHLILAVEDAEYLSRSVQHAGSVFLGYYSPESVGDYASGTNHTLPTGGHARAYAGVSLDSFVRKVTFQQLTREGLEGIGPAVQVLAKAEGLDAHARAVSIRLRKKTSRGS